jgi:K+-transporting ATPase A subunit
MCSAPLSDLIAFCLGLMVMGAVFTILYVAWVTRDEKTYKQGQVDAINGHIYFHLVEQDNGELKWQEIDTADHLINNN